MTSKRKAKKDISLHTRRKLPAYARELLQELDRYADRVYVYEWKELFDTFQGPKSTSIVVLRRLKQTWKRRYPIQEPPEVERCGNTRTHRRNVISSEHN